LGVGPVAQLSSRIFHRLMGRILGRDDLAGQGADAVLLGRPVIDAVVACGEGNLNLFSLLMWLGFRQGTISYAKGERYLGRSAWTFRKRLKLFIDSVAAFSYFPIRFMSMLGIVLALIGFLYAAVIMALYFINGAPIEGWSSLMVVVLVIGGLQASMLGVLGEYLWRTLEEARRRPRYHIEATAGEFSTQITNSHAKKA